MTEVYLIRHAVNDFVDKGRLAGRLPGVHLNDYGNAQAQALGARLASVSLQAVYSSPLERTLETAQAVAAHHPGLHVQVLEGVNELQLGAWEGAELKTVSRRKMWGMVQFNPSRAVFPGGETFRQAQMRAVDAIESVARQHPRATVAVVSHSDIIRLVLAHYLGVHLDTFQRLVISPASISVVQLNHLRPMVVQMNDTSHCPPPPKKDAAPGDSAAHDPAG